MIPVWVLILATAVAWLAVWRLRTVTAVAVAIFGTAVTIYIIAGHPHGLPG